MGRVLLEDPAGEEGDIEESTGELALLQTGSNEKKREQSNSGNQIEMSPNKGASSIPSIPIFPHSYCLIPYSHEDTKNPTPKRSRGVPEQESRQMKRDKQERSRSRHRCSS
jgi:hypothetical protein